MKTLLFLLLITNFTLLNAQCNGNEGNCDKKFNEVAYLTTHNAYNTDSEGFVFPNQHQGIAQQLTDGVRAFMFDVYDLFGSVVQYHGTFTLGFQNLNDDLSEIKTFLDANPNEIVTIIFEAYVDANAIESELISAGLDSYLFDFTDSNSWLTLQEMIDLDQRLVLLTDQNDASANQTYYHYVWDHAVETHYSVNDPLDFTHEFNRGDSINELFIFNHFVTDASIGIGLENQATIVNEYNFLMNRILDNYLEKQKFPNFITLDFYEVGDGLQVVQDLNENYLSIENKIDSISFNLYPSPARTEINIHFYTKFPNEIHLLNVDGSHVKTVKIFSSQTNFSIEEIPSGIYFIQINDGELGSIVKKILIQ